MILKANGAELAAYPTPDGFQVTILDLDDADSTTRTADGTLTRDRVAVKRQIDMTFPALPAPVISALLKQMQDEFFDFYFPDPMEGGYVTKRMYVGNRPATIPIIKNGEIWWSGLQITLTER